MTKSRGLDYSEYALFARIAATQCDELAPSTLSTVSKARPDQCPLVGANLPLPLQRGKFRF